MLTMTAMVCERCRAPGFTYQATEPHCWKCRDSVRKGKKVKAEAAERHRLNALLLAGVEVDVSDRRTCQDCGLLVSPQSKSGRCKPCAVRLMSANRGEDWVRKVREGWTTVEYHSITCCWCKKTAPARLSSKKWCSGACQTAAWRFKKWQAERRAKEAQ